MKRNLCEGLGSWKEIVRLMKSKSASRMSRVAVFMPLCLIMPILGAAQNALSTPPNTENQKCAALAQLNLESAPGGPALITSARLVDVPPNGLEQWFVIPSGYGNTSSQIATRIHQYCEVAGYVAPQNKFLLRLPLPNRDYS